MEIKKHPPITFDEWLSANKYGDWPQHVEEEVDEIELHQTLQYLGMATMEDIRQKIASKAPFQIDILNDLIEQTCQIEEKVLEYSLYFFDHKKAKADSRHQYDEKHRASVDLVLEQDKKQDKLKEMFINKVRSIEHITYPGFYHHEVTPLPGSLEAPHLLNFVTDIQDFSVGYCKTWKKYFLSEASVAIMQDIFWWIFLYLKKKDDKKTQGMLFHRLSNNFVSLFLDVSIKDKDEFFKIYPDCLSQAIYAAFSSAFTASASTFNQKFRREIVSVVFEWITGTHPHVEKILSKWNLENLESRPLNNIENNDDRSSVLKNSLLFDESELVNFSQPATHNLMDDNPQQQQQQDEEVEQQQQKKNFTSKKTKKKTNESHPSGKGTVYEKISFNIHGRSPFIMHYLASKELQLDNEALHKVVTRTQAPPEDTVGRETYQSIVKKQKKYSHLRESKYKAETNQINKDCQELAKQRKKDLRKLKRLQDELMAKHLDIKILSERIMYMMDNANFKTQTVTSLTNDESSDG